jgi:hypothetical protein
MTDAPERIWAQDADPEHCDYEGGGWWDAECGSVQYTHMVEYIRADIAKAEKRAAVAAERERCLSLVPDGSDEWYENLRPVHVKRMLAVLRAAIAKEPTDAD